jgi:hypothetical protein
MKGYQIPAIFGPEYRRRTKGGRTDGTECCFCGRKTDGRFMVALSPQDGRAYPLAYAETPEGQDKEVSGYAIGPECRKKVPGECVGGY